MIPSITPSFERRGWSHALAPDSALLVHRDAEELDRAAFEAECDPTMIVAIPDPATEGWVLRAGGRAPATTVEKCKQQAGDVGWRDESARADLLRACDPDSSGWGVDFRRFRDDVRRVVAPRLGGAP
ncbi:MAG: hypothetical protein KC621_10970 [Myxococcales bacterium]|nr:hypothetical protein [Myxococcales bacterium]